MKGGEQKKLFVYREIGRLNSEADVILNLCYKKLYRYKLIIEKDDSITEKKLRDWLLITCID